jgi:hypothetical protein
MMGIPINGPANVFCDNDAVVKNSSLPESTHRWKHNSIAYHRVREAVAARVIRIATEQTDTNLADLLTKPLPSQKRKALLESILF